MKVITPEEALAIYHAGPEAVVKVICELSAQVVKLSEKINMLEERIKILEEEKSKNSRNSSKPPSSDNRKIFSSRPSDGNGKTGGQKGHAGHTLEIVSNPDHIELHKVEECEHCKFSLSGQKADEIERRQVFDIPPRKLEVTEHQVEIKRCSKCRHVNKARFPDDISAPVQYGCRIKAMAVYFKGYQLLPFERTAELFEDLFSCPLSEGTLDNIIENASQRLEEPVEKIKEQIQMAPVAHFDETGISVLAKRRWLHTVGTKQLTHYEIHDKRGAEAMNAIDILPKFQGRAIHDFWQPYLTYENCEHGLCNAHHLRELIFLNEVQKQLWAKNMIDCLIDMKKAVAESNGTFLRLTKEQLLNFEQRYQQILCDGYAENPIENRPPGVKKRGRLKKSQARNLLERFDSHRKKVLAFMYDFNVPFDNNLAERDIRMAKVQQKISGTFRSVSGAQAFCRIRSYISTVRKNSLHVLTAIENIFKGASFTPQVNIA